MNEQQQQHTILLVEDDRGVQRALAEALHQSGFTVLAEHDGEWARSTFEQRKVDLVVLDAVLPRRNGFQLALDIRRSDKGKRLPILLVSGVYDTVKVKAQLDEIAPPVRFLEKPVEPSKVVAIVRKALGLQESEVSDPSTKRRRRERARLEAKSKDLAALADIAEVKSVESDSQIRFRGAALVRGNLRETDFVEVLAELHRWRATGALLLENPPVKKLVWLKEGAPVFVRSNLLNEALGQLLVRERMINLAECEEGLRRMHESKRQLGTELIEMGCISPANLAYALQLQVEQKLFDVFGWTEGEYRFNPRAAMPAMQIALELTPAKILLEGIKRTYDDARAKKGLGEVEGLTVLLTDDPLDRFQDMGLDPEEAQLYALIDGKHTVRELLDFGALPADDARKLLYALRCANMIHLEQPDAGKLPLPQPIVARPPPLPDVPERAVPEPELIQRQLVERLAARAQDLRRGTLFDVLGMRPDATELEIRHAFAALAKENHPDRLAADAGAEARAFAEDVFQNLDRARHARRLAEADRVRAGDDLRRAALRRRRGAAHPHRRAALPRGRGAAQAGQPGGGDGGVRRGLPALSRRGRVPRLPRLGHLARALAGREGRDRGAPLARQGAAAQPAHRSRVRLSRPHRPRARSRGRGRGRVREGAALQSRLLGSPPGTAAGKARVTLLQERFAEVGPINAMEAQLARAAVAARGRLDPRDETSIRYALSLCRCWHVRAPDGRDVAVAALLRPYREKLVQLLWPLLDPQRPVLAEPHQLLPAARVAGDIARAALHELAEKLGHRLPFERLDREVRERHLVLVCGGGGGTGYVHLAAFALLEAAGLQPDLIAGSSMGAILGLFRARERRFDLARIPEILQDLTYRKIFRIIPQPSTYGLPGPLRLHLRSAIGHWFRHPDGSPLRMSDLPIPLLVTVTGIRRGKLPRPLEEYESMLGTPDPDPSRWGLRALHRNVQRLTAAISELARIPRLTARLVFGASEETRQCDAIDAAGFSASVPGVIHYDIIRDDPRMRDLLDGLLQRHDLLRLCDGGVVDNVPVRTAWQHVQRSGLPGTGSRNAVIFALDGFAPRLVTPLWLPLQSIAAPAVARNRPYAHIYKAFRRTLSPLALLPNQRALGAIVRSAKEELLAELPVLQRLLAPIGPLPS